MPVMRAATPGVARIRGCEHRSRANRRSNAFIAAEPAAIRGAHRGGADRRFWRVFSSCAAAQAAPADVGRRGPRPRRPPMRSAMRGLQAPRRAGNHDRPALHATAFAHDRDAVPRSSHHWREHLEIDLLLRPSIAAMMVSPERDAMRGQQAPTMSKGRSRGRRERVARGRDSERSPVAAGADGDGNAVDKAIDESRVITRAISGMMASAWRAASEAVAGEDSPSRASSTAAAQAPSAVSIARTRIGQLPPGALLLPVRVGDAATISRSQERRTWCRTAPRAWRRQIGCTSTTSGTKWRSRFWMPCLSVAVDDGQPEQEPFMAR